MELNERDRDLALRATALIDAMWRYTINRSDMTAAADLATLWADLPNETTDAGALINYLCGVVAGLLQDQYGDRWRDHLDTMRATIINT